MEKRCEICGRPALSGGWYCEKCATMVVAAERIAHAPDPAEAFKRTLGNIILGGKE